MENSSLALLIAQAQQGNQLAFSQLVKDYQQNVFRYCYTMVHHRQDSEDLTQETFIKAYKYLSSYKNNENFTGWLISIAHKLCLNKFSMNKRLMNLIQNISKDHDHVAYDQSTEVDENDYIFEMLKCLKPKARSIIILKVIHGYTYEEMSYILQDSATNLRYKLSSRHLLYSQLLDYLDLDGQCYDQVFQN